MTFVGFSKTEMIIWFKICEEVHLKYSAQFESFFL